MESSEQVCKICKSPSKYKCPSCLTLSCSLECVNRHKVEFNCNGKKEMVENVPRSEITAETLIKDCKLLDKIAQCMESTSRAFMKPLLENAGHNRTKQRVLRKLCLDRNIELITSPIILKRAKINCTLARKKKLYWTTEWTIHGSGPFLEHRVSEDAVLDTVRKKVSEKVKRNCEDG
ncbi:conserved hypothetical protein [Theileria equi strain WA]|uniref:HIT-type domain-containing protein n=1 Tax=Theileria equi strain WA TaxID=1537102 RepID=L1LC22_THEEQ|nr:conserved hypothetical protein [Theileria equi strain WA]EKX72997.1 conserved hypothetical protein [Theileria equi strain WA]|eukprot:XP_004832449.1 conserved hypothetical protein [Theileria equi strain WA]